MERRLSCIEGNRQRLDGGAMFGNVPKALWSRWLTPDEDNCIPLACRGLLVQHQGRNLLFETGIGCFFEPKMRERFGVEESNHALLDNLATLGLSDRDIDVVVLSHLHFDHAGGLLGPYQEGAHPTLLFPKAKFVVGEEAFERASRPHPRDRASFIPALPGLLQDSGRLELVHDHSESLGPDYRFHHSSGHTPGLLLAEIPTSLGPVVFAADLIPGRPWVHLPITMGYDRYPERLIDEKRTLLEDLESRGGWLYFTHDPEVIMGKLQIDDRGRFSVGEALRELSGLPA